MEKLGGGDGGHVVWEEDLVVKIRNLLSNITLQDSETDAWLWRPDTTVGYTVCGVYQMLTRQKIQVHDVASDAPWHKNVPLKVSLFVLGVSSAIDGRQRTTWCVEVLFLMTINCVFQDVVNKKQ